MKRYLKFVTPLVSLFVLFMLIFFKTIPSGKLWKGFNIIYVPVETEDSVVQDAFKALEITDHFELSGQYLPLLFTAYSPEVTMLKLNAGDSSFQYLSKRNAYFFDKSNRYRLYYISSDNKSKVNDCVKLLARQNIKAGVDGSASYPFLILVIALAYFMVLLVYSKHKFVFGAGSSLLLVYIFCNPFYSCAVSLCLFMLCIFFYSNIWKRKGNLMYLFGNYAIPVMLFFAVTGAFAGSVKAGFMFILAAAGSVGMIYTVYYVSELILSRRSFIPVSIRPAKRVSIYGGKLNQILISSICAVVFLFTIALITTNTSVKTKFAKLILPSAQGNSEELPAMDEYYDFVWNVSAYPYRNLNKNEKANYFEYPHYEEIDGKIKETLQVKAFNDSFKTETYDAIDLLPFNSIEKLIKSQGSEVKPGYASSSSCRTGIFAIIMMFVSLTILLFIYISSIIRKGVRK